MIGGVCRAAGMMAALAVLGFVLAGCVSDLGASSGTSTHQMRYYGGPKYPMWSSQ